MKILEPITIKGMSLRNRVVMAPMVVGVGLTSRRARAYYVERARGGVGTIITGASVPDFFASDEAWGYRGGREDFIQEVYKLTEAVHGEGAKIGAQICYGNRYPAYKSLYEGGERVAPSPRIGRMEWWEEVAELRELTVGEIEDIICRFALGAKGAREAGFDFVELHGAHLFLLREFFSPIHNRRHDKYGGDLTGRMRFGLECLKAVRREVGEDFPIFYRIGAWEERPDGIGIEDSVQFAKELERNSLDVIDVSVASEPREDHFLACPPKEAPMGTFAWIARSIKREVKIPVIAVGKINSHEVAEEILTQGKADLVAVGRQLIADPFWVKKAEEARFGEIVACQCCNEECFDHMRGKQFGCKVNPRAGREFLELLGQSGTA